MNAAVDSITVRALFAVARGSTAEFPTELGQNFTGLPGERAPVTVRRSAESGPVFTH